MIKLKVGDNVMVRTGKWRTKTGVIEKILPERMAAIVTGINIQKKHQKKSASKPQGGIIERPAPIGLSKLMLIDDKSKKPTRIHFKTDGKGKQRVTTKGDVITEKSTKETTTK